MIQKTPAIGYVRDKHGSRWHRIRTEMGTLAPCCIALVSSRTVLASQGPVFVIRHGLRGSSSCKRALRIDINPDQLTGDSKGLIWIR